MTQLFHAHAVANGAVLHWLWWPEPSPDILSEFERLAAAAEETALTYFEEHGSTSTHSVST